MRRALRIAAVAIAVAGVVDPAIARRTTAPLSLEFRLPPPSDPQYAQATTVRDAIANQLQPGTVVDASLRPDALIAIANAETGALDGARVIAVPVSAPMPGTAIIDVSAPARTIAGQSAEVSASIRAAGCAGRTSTITLDVHGSAIQSLQHKWTSNDERFDARLTFAPPSPGVHRLRIRVNTEGAVDTSLADTILVTRGEPARVLAYEPRPSWPVTFLRRALEADSLFAVASTARTSRTSGTNAGDPPRSLSDLDADRYDLVIVGALDEVRESELDRLERFVTKRGGTLLLLPDRRVPASVSRRFGLPQSDELLLEKPVSVQGAGFSLLASELLLTSPEASVPLASIRHGGRTATAIASINRGEGRVVLSGVLDGWRFRGSAAGGFESFWRALAADAALAAPPKLAVAADPAIARPGDGLHISVSVRMTEFDGGSAQASVRPVSASLVDSAGGVQTIRLWPGPRLGSLVGRIAAPAGGRYTLSASMEGTVASIPLLVADDVVHPAADFAAANAYAARATGGAVVGEASDVGPVLASFDTGRHDETIHPMRSWWWIVPFSTLLCVEWAWRRRSGLK